MIKVIAQLAAYLVRFDSHCTRCKVSHATNFTDHLLLDCEYSTSIRDAMYLNISTQFGPELSETVRGLPRNELTHTFLGLWHPLLDEYLQRDDRYFEFVCIVFRYVHRMYLNYPR